MKRFLLVSILIVLFGLPAQPAFAQEAAPSENVQGQGYFELPLCLPGMPADGSCLALGPAQTVAEMKAMGIPYPMRELPAAQPPAEMAVMPVSIARINLPEVEPAPVYASFDDAVAENNPVRYIPPGRLRFVRFIFRRDHNNRPYVQLSSGEWMRAAPTAYTNFQGLEFYENPRNDFGWIVSYDPISSYLEPRFNAPSSGHTYNRGDVIQVYSSVQEGDYIWYKIGLDEWIHHLAAAVVVVNPTRPEGVTRDRWVEIDLFAQTLSIYEDGRLVFATVLATGRPPFYTRPGVFEIYKMQEVGPMQGSFEADGSDFYYLEDVPWVIYYDGSIALHSTYWHFGYGFPQSHGCVNLSPGDANWLFQWADLGDYVWVHDPSGQTPTDLPAPINAAP